MCHPTTITTPRAPPQRAVRVNNSLYAIAYPPRTPINADIPYSVYGEIMIFTSRRVVFSIFYWKYTVILNCRRVDFEERHREHAGNRR